MWVLIVIILILLFLGKPKKHARRIRPAATKAEPSNKPIADKLNELVRMGMNKPFNTGPHTTYVQTKMRLLLMNDPRFKNLNKAFKEGYTYELPDYAFTEENHQDADIYYNRAYCRYDKEFRNKVELLWQKKAGATHVYICPNLGKRCDSVKKIEKPKIYPIDEVPIIPCADCTEPFCYCSYHTAKKSK